MAFKARGELIDLTDTVRLRASFADAFGNPTNTDAVPTITIFQPSGTISVNATSMGVYQVATGVYGFDYSIGLDYAGSYGVWNDNWKASVNGVFTQNTFSFVVSHTDLPGINTDGYLALGDDPGFNYSQLAIFNINKLIKTLKARLNSSGKSKSTDSFGNVIYVDCDIFSIDMLVSFLANALSDFNQIPFFSFYTFEDLPSIFHDIIVEGATITALASQALIERGREFTISDNSVNFTPPSMSEALMTQYSTLLSNYTDKLKMIKSSLRSPPINLGTISTLSGGSPQWMRLRHRKEGRLV